MSDSDRPIRGPIRGPIRDPIRRQTLRWTLRWILRWIGVALPVLVMLGGCSARPVVPATEFPAPVLVRVPASMGLFMDARFAGHEHVDKPPKGFEQKIAVGPASQALFTEFLRAQFRTLTVLAENPAEQPPPAGVEAVLHPVIEDVQIATPRSDKDEFHEAWIKYRLNLRDTHGRLLAAWEIAAYGKHRGSTLGGTHAALTAAVHDALRDAAAGMALIFRDGTAFRQRLDAALAAQPSVPAGAP